MKAVAKHAIRRTLDTIHLKMNSFHRRQNDTWIYSKFIPRAQSL